MFTNNFKMLGIIVLITTFVFSNSLQYQDLSFASSQNATTSNMSKSITTHDGLDNSINSTNVRQYESNY